MMIMVMVVITMIIMNTLVTVLAIQMTRRATQTQGEAEKVSYVKTTHFLASTGLMPFLDHASLRLSASLGQNTNETH